MSETAKALGTNASTFEFEGTVYTVTPFNTVMIGEFELWIEGQAWAVLKRAKSHISAEDYAEARSELLASIAAGDYSYPRPNYFRAAFSKAGLQQCLWQSLRVKHPDITRELAARMVKEKLDEVITNLTQA